MTLSIFTDSAAEGDQSHVTSGPGLTLFFACLGAGGLGSALLADGVPFIVSLAVGLYLLFSIKVAAQWQKVVVLRFGRYRGLRGPRPVHHRPRRRLGEPVRGPAGASDRRSVPKRP